MGVTSRAYSFLLSARLAVLVHPRSQFLYKPTLHIATQSSACWPKTRLLGEASARDRCRTLDAELVPGHRRLDQDRYRRAPLSGQLAGCRGPAHAQSAQRLKFLSPA